MPFAYLTDAMIRLTLFLNADNHAIFLAFCSFCNQLFSKVKKRTLNFLAPGLKSAIKINRMLHLGNVDVKFCNFFFFFFVFFVFFTFVVLCLIPLNRL